MSTYDGKTISVKEFRELGLVQEINRRFLHPLGLAMEVIIDGNTGEERIERFWDARDDPEGWNFGEGMIDPQKAQNVDHELEKRAHARITTLGYVVQPIPGVDIPVHSLGMGERFGWQNAVWKITARGPHWVEATNEQFSNVQVFKEFTVFDEVSWFTQVRRV